MSVRLVLVFAIAVLNLFMLFPRGQSWGVGMKSILNKHLREQRVVSVLVSRPERGWLRAVD